MQANSGDGGYERAPSDVLKAHDGADPLLSVRPAHYSPKLKRQQMIRRIIWIGVGILVFATLAGLAFALYSIYDEQKRIKEAGHYGDAKHVSAALSVLDADKAHALRLRAMRSFYQRDMPSELNAAIDAGAPTDRAIVVAKIYRSMTENNLTEAERLAAILTPKGTYAAEEAFVKGLVDAQFGRHSLAVEWMEAASKRAGNAPRYRAALVEEQAKTDLELAQKSLEELPEHSSSDRAKVIVGVTQMTCDESCHEAVARVQKSEQAYQTTRAYALIAQAIDQARLGNRTKAYEILEPQASLINKADESLRLAYGKALLLAGQTKEAQSILNTVTTTYSQDNRARQSALAALGIAIHHHDYARQVLGETTGPEADLIRADLTDAIEAAEGFYQRSAAGSEWLAPFVYQRLAKRHFEAGHNEEASKYANQGLNLAPKHPEISTTLARALHAENKLEAATQLLNDTASAHPKSPALLFYRMLFGAESQSWPLVLELGRFANEHQILYEGAEMNALHADAARELNEHEEAAIFYEKALDEDSENGRANIGALTLALDVGDLKKAQTTLSRVLKLRMISEETAIQRARYYVASGTGAVGVRKTKYALKRYRSSARFRGMVGELYFQAGLYKQAAAHFAKAHAIDENHNYDMRRVASLSREGLVRVARGVRGLKDKQGIDAVLARGWYALAKEDRAGAKSFSEEALSLAPERGEANYLWAITHPEAEESAKLDALRKAASTLNKPYTAAKETLALKLGRSEEACENILAFRKYWGAKLSKPAIRLFRSCR